MRKINKIIVHSSATRPSQDIGAEEIRDWHIKGNGWSDIGYHFVIRRDGTRELGRDIALSGAHCKNQNSRSLGICLVGGATENDVKIGENNFTDAQFKELQTLLKQLLTEHPNIVRIAGHRDFANKACPCFDVQGFCEKHEIDAGHK